VLVITLHHVQKGGLYPQEQRLFFGEPEDTMPIRRGGAELGTKHVRFRLVRGCTRVFTAALREIALHHFQFVVQLLQDTLVYVSANRAKNRARKRPFHRLPDRSHGGKYFVPTLCVPTLCGRAHHRCAGCHPEGGGEGGAQLALSPPIGGSVQC